jgi:glucoamylase
VVLGLIQSGLNDGFLGFTNDHVSSTYEVLRAAFLPLYSINSAQGYGPSFGRYPEDQYDGYETGSVGNPWVLTTVGAAELLYDTSIELMGLTQNLVVTSNNITLFSRILGSTLTVNQNLAPHSAQIVSLAQGLFNEADLLMSNVLYHRNPDGSLSEEINRDSGYMQGAPNLSWSHSAFITASEARNAATKVLNNAIR